MARFNIDRSPLGFGVGIQGAPVVSSRRSDEGRQPEAFSLGHSYADGGTCSTFRGDYLVTDPMEGWGAEEPWGLSLLAPLGDKLGTYPRRAWDLTIRRFPARPHCVALSGLPGALVSRMA